MCTERTPDAIVVCDVAIDDVRAAMAPLGNVEITHLPYEGNLVAIPDSTHRDEFRAVLAGAIAKHGGFLA